MTNPPGELIARAGVTRYAMEKPVGSVTMMPLVRKDGDWVKFADVVDICDANQRLRREADKAAATLESQQARIAVLEAAAKPFAEYARVSGYGRIVVNDPESVVFGTYSDEVAVVTKRDLARVARIALARTRTTGGGK